jgi:signal transduction histidine kinase
VLKTRDGVLCANAMTDERFHGENNQDSIHRLGLRSIVCVPIVARDQIHGIFYLDCSMSHHTYTQEQLRLVVAIGRLAGLAIENVRLVQSRVRTERLAAAGEAVAYLSHHIRNILQGMQGGAEVVELAMKRQAFDMMRSGWTLMRRNLDRIYLLTLNMLTFSKDRKPRIESAHLNAILSDVVSLAQGRADEKGVMILTEFEEIPAIPIDPDGMHQVAHNILLNALEAAPKEGGRVILSTHYEPTAGCVRMAVSDNGPGIDPKDRDRIFDVFHSSKGHAGTGLGLAAAKKIVAEMNGSIDVESALNEGTTFVVILSATHIRLADSDKTHGPDA